MFQYLQQITKSQVDHFVPDGRVPSCQLHLEWHGQQEQPVELAHRVKLLGAKEPNNWIVIFIQPPSLQGWPTVVNTRNPILLDTTSNFCTTRLADCRNVRAKLLRTYSKFCHQAMVVSLLCVFCQTCQFLLDFYNKCP